jgi:hypothetical protein
VRVIRRRVPSTESSAAQEGPYFGTDFHGHSYEITVDGKRSSYHSYTTNGRSVKSFFSGSSTSSQTFYSARSRTTENEPRKLPTLSKFLTTIKERGLLPNAQAEVDWSGKGQHVEYAPNEDVPLEVGRVVGHSSTAVVQAVTCRKIKLARKTIQCRRMRLEDALCEVSHLQKLDHGHIVQVIGTYLQGTEFSILLYPLAEWDLGAFLRTDDIDHHKRSYILESVLPCLLSAIGYIRNTVRHMDIKPSSISTFFEVTSLKLMMYRPPHEVYI